MVLFVILTTWSDATSMLPCNFILMIILNSNCKQYLYWHPISWYQMFRRNHSAKKCNLYRECAQLVLYLSVFSLTVISTCFTRFTWLTWIYPAIFHQGDLTRMLVRIISCYFTSCYSHDSRTEEVNCEKTRHLFCPLNYVMNKIVKQ